LLLFLIREWDQVSDRLGSMALLVELSAPKVIPLFSWRVSFLFRGVTALLAVGPHG
jgi:hypothetical protein